MNIPAIIPARAGSKGVPGKNLLKIGNFTLVERALFTAISTKKIDDIIVSTDSKKIRDVVNKYGNYAPFLRPQELAIDTANSLGFLKHALEWKNNVNTYDYVVLLEPPCPFRLPTHIEEGLDIAVKNNASSTVSLVDVGDYHPIRMKKISANGSLKGVIGKEPDGLRRQDQEAVFIRNSAVYIFNTKTLIENKLWGANPYGFVMDKELYSINIDEPNDYLLACSFYKEMLNKGKTNLIESIL